MTATTATTATSTVANENTTATTTPSPQQQQHQLIQCPNLVGAPCSLLLSRRQLTELRKQLPAEQRMHNDWILLYSSRRMGTSIKQFTERCLNRGPTIVLIRDSFGKVFGGFASQDWKRYGQFYGDSNCFLFTFNKKNPSDTATTEQNDGTSKNVQHDHDRDDDNGDDDEDKNDSSARNDQKTGNDDTQNDETHNDDTIGEESDDDTTLQVYRSSNHNDNYMYFNEGNEFNDYNGLAMGGRMNFFCLSLDRTFSRGTSRPDLLTYGSSPSLCTDVYDVDDAPIDLDQYHFIVDQIEVWSFPLSESQMLDIQFKLNQKQARLAFVKGDDADYFIMESAGKVGAGANFRVEQKTDEQKMKDAGMDA